MKKLLCIAVVGLMFATSALTVSAQVTNATNAKGATTGYLLSDPTHGIVDTATNAVTKIQKLEIIGYQASLVLQPLFTKISGTVGGTATLKGSIDGQSWATIGSAFTLTDVASQNTTIDAGSPKFKYYQLEITGTGTMAVKVQTPWLTRTPK